MRGLVLLLAAACTRAEYRCHHNIGQDYCAKVIFPPLRSLLLASPAPSQLVLSSSCSLCRSASYPCAPSPRPLRSLFCSAPHSRGSALQCAPGEAPPGGGHRSSRTGKCEPYNNPGTECTAPMSVDDTFDARVTQDVATMYEGKLGIVPDQLACGKNASGGGLAVWELVNGTLQPCRAGLFRMMLDNDTNTSYHRWSDNFEAWMEMHLGHLEVSL